ARFRSAAGARFSAGLHRALPAQQFLSAFLLPVTAGGSPDSRTQSAEPDPRSTTTPTKQAARRPISAGGAIQVSRLDPCWCSDTHAVSVRRSFSFPSGLALASRRALAGPLRGTSEGRGLSHNPAEPSAASKVLCAAGIENLAA